MQGKNNEPHLQSSAWACSTPLMESLRYGVYDEGNGVLSAYFPSKPSAAAKQFLAEMAGDRVLLLLSGSQRPHSGIPLSGGHALYSPEALSELKSPAEAIVLESVEALTPLESSLPSSLLCAPHHSLPQEFGALFALVLPDRNHFTLLTRDPHFLSQLVVCQLQLSTGPEFPDHIRDQLVAPQDPWTWREVNHCKKGGVQILTVQTQHSEQESLSESILECVAPREGGFWRAGWSW